MLMLMLFFACVFKSAGLLMAHWINQRIGCQNTWFAKGSVAAALNDSK